MRAPEPPRSKPDKIKILYMEAERLWRPPRKHSELADLCGWSKPSGVSNHFGPGEGYPSDAILGKVCWAFDQAGVTVMPEWFTLSTEEFRRKVIDARSDTRGNWVISPAYNADTDLSELLLHEPTPTNKSGTYYPNTTLEFGLTTANGENHSVVIGLKEAELAVESTSYQLTPMEGDSNGNANWKRVSGGAVRFTGPTEYGCLNGAPLGQEKLLKIEYVETQEREEVTAVVRFPLLVFALVAAHLSDNQSPIDAEEIGNNAGQQGLLSAFIQKKLQRDEKNRPILSRATMRRLVS